MTCIAYRHGVLAADRAVTSNGSRLYDVCKVSRRADGALIAVAGSMGEAVAMKRWLLDGANGQAPTHRENNGTEAVLVLPSGDVYEWESGVMIGPIFPAAGRDFFAWGSGAPAALGAMMMGASAKKAVEVASQVNLYTSAAVDCVSLEPIPLDVAVRQIRERLSVVAS